MNDRLTMKRIVNDAADIPHACTINETSRAMLGSMLNPRVKTGYATDPPPSLVMPTIELNKTLEYLS